MSTRSHDRGARWASVTGALAGGLAWGIVACARPAVEAAIPPGVRYLPRAAWGASAPVKPMIEHVPERITIHHTATRIDTLRSLGDKLRALQRFSQTEGALASGHAKPVWGDVPYHFYISGDGEVGQGRELRYAGDSNTPYDPTGHLLIVVEGNFEEETPTSAQLATLERLVLAFASQWSIPGERITGHRDYASTRCPGRNLASKLPRLRLLAGSSGRRMPRLHEATQ